MEDIEMQSMGKMGWGKNSFVGYFFASAMRRKLNEYLGQQHKVRLHVRFKSAISQEMDLKQIWQSDAFLGPE